MHTYNELYVEHLRVKHKYYIIYLFNCMNNNYLNFICRPNMFLTLKQGPSMNFDRDLDWGVKLLKEKQITAEKTIIYCQSLNHVAKIWQYIMEGLGPLAWKDEVRETENRVVTQYHHFLEEDVKTMTEAEFVKPDSVLRCLVSTIAFGMGVNIPDIHYVVHWGISGSILSYWQEVGRCARGIDQGEAVLYATATSLLEQRKPGKQVKQPVNDMIPLCNDVKVHGSCVRLSILTPLVHGVMDVALLGYLNDRKCTDTHGAESAFDLWLCCTTCRAKCTCTTLPEPESAAQSN
jgi:superfamily II DNA helicase RecQ